MKNKTTYWALGIMTVIAVAGAVFTAFGNDPYAGIGYMIFLLIFLGVEILILLLLGLAAHLQSRSDDQPTAELKERSKRYLLAALMVLLVGFSVCVGGGLLIGG